MTTTRTPKPGTILSEEELKEFNLFPRESPHVLNEYIGDSIIVLVEPVPDMVKTGGRIVACYDTFSDIGIKIYYESIRGLEAKS